MRTKILLAALVVILTLHVVSGIEWRSRAVLTDVDVPLWWACGLIAEFPDATLLASRDTYRMNGGLYFFGAMRFNVPSAPPVDLDLELFYVNNSPMSLYADINRDITIELWGSPLATQPVRRAATYYCYRTLLGADYELMYVAFNYKILLLTMFCFPGNDASAGGETNYDNYYALNDCNGDLDLPTVFENNLMQYPLQAFSVRGQSLVDKLVASIQTEPPVGPPIVRLPEC